MSWVDPTDFRVLYAENVPEFHFFVTFMCDQEIQPNIGILSVEADPVPSGSHSVLWGKESRLQLDKLFGGGRLIGPSL